MHPSILLTLLPFLMGFTTCLSSNILFFTLYGSHSHVYNIMPAIEALDARGHNITYLTLMKPKLSHNSNVTILQLKDVKNFLDVHEATFFYKEETRSSLSVLQYLKMITIDTCKVFLQDETFQFIVKENETRYDVIVMDPTFSECGLSLVWLLRSPPLIYYCPTYLPSWISLSLAIPTPFSYIPTIFNSYTDYMTFKKRCVNTFQYIKLWVLRNFILLPGIEKALYKVYPTMPNLLDIERNISFVFANSHSQSLDFSRPSMGYFAEVGGAHCRPPNPLQKDLEQFIDGSGEHGFIYFALGSYIRSEDMRQEGISSLLEAFGRLKETVIWKYDGNISNMPSNIHLLKWAPQQDILGHPKIKVFISHGGQLSIQEAIYHGVPILGMPFVADEFFNIKNLVDKGMAEEMNYFNFDVETVYAKLIMLINDKRYKKNAIHYSALMHDRPHEAVKTVVYWVEYVIRHKGAHHLRKNADIHFLRYFLLDIIGSTLTALVIVILTTVYITRRVCRKTVHSPYQRIPSTEDGNQNGSFHSQV